MLLDPTYLLEHPGAVLAVTVLVVVAKAVAAFGIVAVLGYPVRIGLTVAAALAQIGEFTFILATLGLSLGLLPDTAFQLVVAGSITSITLNPFVFRLVDPIENWLRQRPRWLVTLERRPAELAILPAGTDDVRGHAILAGYGRVGRLIAGALERRGFRYVVISDDRREVDRLRQAQTPALFGDAANEDLLEAAGLDRAKVMIVAISDPQSTRLIVNRARERMPRIPLVVRTHSGTEAVHLRTLGSTVQAVYAEGEVAIQMTRFSLRRFGVSANEVEAIAAGLRTGRGGEPGGGSGAAAASPSLQDRIRAFRDRRRGGTESREVEDLVDRLIVGFERE
jgi:CPA2 family monovalent cation:H+ antiporter-2